jgi:hypothetical protein
LGETGSLREALGLSEILWWAEKGILWFNFKKNRILKLWCIFKWIKSNGLAKR